LIQGQKPLWALLIGNPRAVAGLMRGNRVLKRWVVPTDSLRTRAGATTWARRIRRISSAQGLFVANVVPSLRKPIRTALLQTFGSNPEFVEGGKGVGIAAIVPHPSQVGADRLANAAAARELYGGPVIVVDYGTGTTFDVVDRRGRYCGGAILPGLGISLRALHQFTAKIPLVEFKRVRRAIGRTTEEAVRSGLYHGAIGTTRELLARIRGELGVMAPAVATGGWSYVFRNTKLFYEIEPDLTLIGLSVIWRDRHA